MKKNSTQLEYEQFVFEWKAYRNHYRLSHDQAATSLFFCCSEEIRTQIRIRQKCIDYKDKWTESELLELIKDIATSKVSRIVHIKQFLNMKQHAGETCEDYLGRLEVKASCCNFSCVSCNVSNAIERIREKFVLGLQSHVIQTQLLRTESISPGTPLNNILDEALTLEQSITDQAAIANETRTTFLAEHSDSESSKDVFAMNKLRRGNNQSSGKSVPCSGCGSKEHKDNERSSKCRAWRLKCHFCGNMGHIEKMCRKAKARQNSDSPHVRSTEMSCMVIGEISSLNLPISVKPILHNHKVEYVNISVFPDTGANICLLGPDQLQTLKLPISYLNSCHHCISVAGGSSILATGWFKAVFNLNNNCTEQTVYYADKAQRFFLSRQCCIDLGIVPLSFPFPPSNENSDSKLVATLDVARTAPSRPVKIPFIPCEKNISELKKFLIESFADSAFNKTKPFPKLSTPPAHIHLKPGFVIPKPAYWPARISDHWAEQVKKSIDEDVAAGILTKVPFNEPATWCARMVVVSKRDGRPRRTVDFQQLNAQCVREPNYGESPFHTARRIPPNTWKSVFDAVDGYHAVELDSESSKLTTFVTPWGRYRYLRFPQGHCSAGDAFNGRVQQILSRIPRLVRIVDDMCLYDDTIEGSFWSTWELLETCVNNGIVLNMSKFQFCRKTIKLLA